ncbi:SDR family NAD(P)-dependent oxidoreductase [Laceyella putida]|uniref:SDR family NAD(P)-dependent oxidoreductase n=1 Tax=Laceyella putida TaxID=110101 RepID=A0ABW2RJY5_9BACL
MNKPIVLITGASSGIGEEIAKQLVLNGYFPILAARNMQALNKIKQELTECEVIQCDVTRDTDVKHLVDRVIRQFGRIDILINNAGYGRFGGTLDISLEDYQGMMETNYLGAVRTTYAVLPHMLQKRGGRIINIASLAGLTGIPNLAGYCATKFALIGFSESLRLEYSPMIQIGVLCPGPVMSPFFGKDDPSRYFPSPIARQMLDTRTVARHAIELIERPRMMVIPHKLKWALKLRHLFPGLYFWATQLMYGRMMPKDREVSQPISQ